MVREGSREGPGANPVLSPGPETARPPGGDQSLAEDLPDNFVWDRQSCLEKTRAETWR